MEIGSSQPSGVPDPPLSVLVEQQQRLWRRVLNLPRVVESAVDTAVGTTPCDVVLTRGTFKLVRYRRETPAAFAEPVLFCYALINRPYILDLQPDKSVVARYLAQGFDVYLIDWGAPSDADHVLTIEDYVCGFLRECVELIARAHARQDVHLLGYCMGGTMTALFASLQPERARTLTLLAAPIDFRGRESLLNLWSDPQYFDVDSFIDTHGNCPAWFLQSCFLTLKPIQNLFEKNVAFYEQMDDPRAVSSYFAMERWVNDNIPVAGETFRVFVKQLYQGNALTRGDFHVGGQRIDLGRIRCPLLLLTAKNDHLVAPSSTEGIRPHVGSGDVQSMSIEAGHVGLVVGGKAQKTIWPAATRWMAERSTPVPMTAAPEETASISSGPAPADAPRKAPGGTRRSRVAIACQGGGSHTAFTAGVLQGLMANLPDDVDVVALSGTSGGAICAALAWDGFVRRDPRRAIEKLQGFWDATAASDPLDKLANQVVMSAMSMRDMMVMPEVSPYHLPTWGEEKFRAILNEYFDFEELRNLAGRPGAPVLQIGAVEVLSGHFELFTGTDLCVECLLASAAIPEMFRAVSVPGRGMYWDGLFSQNPPIHDLLAHQIDELWVIQINSSTCARVPTETHEILDRRNALSGNLSMEQELSFIDMLNRAIARGQFSDPNYRPIRVGRIPLDRDLGYRSKLDRRPELLRELQEYGRTKWRWFLKERESRRGGSPS